MLKLAAFQKHSVDINIGVGVEVIFGVGVGVKIDNKSWEKKESESFVSNNIVKKLLQKSKLNSIRSVFL